MKPVDIVVFIIYFALTVFAGFLFYDNILVGALAGAAFFYPFFRSVRKKRKEKMMEKKELCFMRALEMMAASVSAGTTLQDAVKETIGGDYSVDIGEIREDLKAMDRMICLNCDVTEAFGIMADKTQSREIICFSKALSSVSQAGGDIVSLMLENCEIIRKKYEAKEEIKNNLTEPRLSLRIMALMPGVLILIMRTMAPDYISYLYSLSGHIVMTAVVLMCIGAFCLGNRIGDISL